MLVPTSGIDIAEISPLSPSSTVDKTSRTCIAAVTFFRKVTGSGVGLKVGGRALGTLAGSVVILPAGTPVGRYRVEKLLGTVLVPLILLMEPLLRREDSEASGGAGSCGNGKMGSCEG